MRKLLEFHRSPNSVKVRIALNVKGLEYETEEMMAADRKPMIEAAGWPLTPILLDGDVVMRDSTAILHYLEANYPDRPNLTPASIEDIHSAERIVAALLPEIQAALGPLRSEVQKPEGERDFAAVEVGRGALVAALARLEERLADRDWLVGDRMTIYDIILASTALPVRAPARFVEQSPMWRFFQDHFRIDSERPKVAAWIDRVMAHDRP